MSVELIKYAFVAGELSPAYYGRGDLEKFDLGLALARNWIVDYRGGITTRPGQRFVDYVMEDDKDVRWFEFKFSPDIANTYVVLFGHKYIRFIQDGAYILEAAKNISAVTKANPGVVTANAHGFTAGDWVKITGVAGMTELNGRTFQVGTVTTNTFQLLHPAGGANVNTSTYGTYTSGGTVARIYTVDSPYESTDLEGISVSQIRDLLRITSNEFPIYNLQRNSAASWTLAPEDLGNTLTRPSGLAVTADASGSGGTTFAVTTVLRDGSESLASDIYLAAGLSPLSDGGWYRYSWTSVPGAYKYNVYRSVLASSNDSVTRAAELGYIGSSFGPRLHDENIAPDFTRAPPVHRDPFAAGAIEEVEITAGGTGYDGTTTITVTDADGSGFVGYPIIASGAVVSVVIVNGGSGYTNPSFSFSVGTGATVNVTLSASTGNFPALSTVFQQRQIYAATINDPLTIWGSQPGRFSNFDESQVIVDSDSYEHEIDAEQLAPIRHIIPMRGGLLVFSQTGIWQIRGGNNNDAITPLQVTVDPQSFTGVAKLPPLKIDTDILYKEGKGSVIRQLSYNEFSRVYSGRNVSILSSHFFSSTKDITSWSYASDPHSVVWGVRADGAMLAFTVVKEQDVYAWTQCWTKGLYKHVLAIQEGLTDTVYMIVQRYVNGRWTKFIEQQVTREIGHVEDAFCVDCGLELSPTYPAATLSVDTYTGEATFTASANVFSSGDIGKILRVGGGKAEITQYNSQTEVIGTFLRDATIGRVPEDDSGRLVPAVEGTWTLDAKSTVISGLWHLEGESVTILADGNVFSNQTVANGKITLPVGVTRAAIGLSYTCMAKTLPLITREVVIEGRRKRVVGIAPRLRDTRGLEMGAAEDSLYAMKERSDEPYNEPTELQQGVHPTLIEPDWNSDGQIVFKEAYPLPATILGYVVDAEIGDDPN